MISRVISAANIGYDGQLIQIECDSSNGLPGLIIVGLGNKAIEESKERMRSAIKQSGLDFPRKRITLNLAPANLPKDGSSYDLPMALAILAISGQLPESALANTLFAGELALDGSIRALAGIIGYLETAKRAGVLQAIVPAENIAQAQLVDGMTLFGAHSLKEVFLHLTKMELLPKISFTPPSPPAQPRAQVSLDEIYGQEQAKRALLIAAAGHHNLLMHGPPGSGKTMLAKALVSLLPPPAWEEVIAITKLHSLAGELREEVMTARPFRSPHHTSSSIALIGGGPRPRPGEVSLAHHGVLFLDELPEYPRATLEALRQPLEDRSISIARAYSRLTFPADFMLVATQNPCPCGYLGDSSKECTCTGPQLANYNRRVSGPLLDRIDMVIKVGRVQQSKLLSHTRLPPEFTAKKLAQQIIEVRKRQHQRFGTKLRTNAHLTSKEIIEQAMLSSPAKAFLDQAATKLDLSARSYTKVIRVSRTIADLEESEQISEVHLGEALQYRQR